MAAFITRDNSPVPAVSVSMIPFSYKSRLWQQDWKALLFSESLREWANTVKLPKGGGAVWSSYGQEKWNASHTCNSKLPTASFKNVRRNVAIDFNLSVFQNTKQNIYNVSISVWNLSVHLLLFYVYLQISEYVLRFEYKPPIKCSVVCGLWLPVAQED